MANGPFDRTILNVRERALSSDINQAESQLDYSLRFALQQLLAKDSGFSSGFIGASYKVVPNSPAGMSVLVQPGLGLLSDPADVPAAIGGIVGLDDLSSAKPLVLNAPQQFTVPANASGNPRIDIIEVKVDRRAENPTSRLIYNAITGAFDPTSVNKTLAFSHDGRLGTVATPANSTTGIGYKTGTPAGSPVAPATSPGYLKIAEINVAAGAATITASEIVDRRAILGVGGVVQVAARYRLEWNGGAPVVSNQFYQAPGGVTVVAAPDSSRRGRSFLFVIGGFMQSVSPVVSGEVHGVTLGAAETVVSRQGLTALLTTPSGVQTIDSAAQTLLAGLGVQAAIGASYVQVQTDAQHIDAGGVNITNVALQDMFWNVRVAIRYS